MKKIALLIAAFCLVATPAVAQKTQSQLTTEISNNLPSGQPNVLTAASLRQVFNDVVLSTNVQGTTCPTTALTLYQNFTNTIGAPTQTTLNFWDGVQCVPWAVLNQSTHVLSLTGRTDLSFITATGTSSINVATYDGVTLSGKTAWQITNSDNSALVATEHYSAWIGATTNGTGDGSVPATTYALGVSAVKNSWTTTNIAGEYGAINAVVRGGDNNVLTSGDAAAYTANAGVSFSNNFVAQFEGVGGFLPGGSTTGSLFVNTQLGSVRSSGLDIAGNTGVGFLAQAQNGLLGWGIQLSNLCVAPKFGTCSKWNLGAFNFLLDDGTHTTYSAFTVGPTGLITSGGAAASGALTLAGSTSGTRALSVNATATTFTFGGGALSTAEGGTGDTGTAWTTFTPTPTCGTATFTTTSARSKTIAKFTFLQIDYTITAIGNCASGNVTFTLPNTANSSGLAAAGQETVNSGLFGGCRVASASATATCAKSGGGNWVVNDHFIGSGVYENQ